MKLLMGETIDEAEDMKFEGLSKDYAEKIRQYLNEIEKKYHDNNKLLEIIAPISQELVKHEEKQYMEQRRKS